jgi:serine O-acetyltransferase
MQETLNFWYIGRALAENIRSYNKYRARRGIFARIMCKYWKLRHLLLSVVTGSDLDSNATIGERFMLPHPNGVVVHGGAVIGDDCMIMQQVTIGQLSDIYAPVIGSRVYIGAGAKVLGKVVVGDGARIGANAVVLCDVPANWTAVGIPARVLPPKTLPP